LLSHRSLLLRDGDWGTNGGEDRSACVVVTTAAPRSTDALSAERWFHTPGSGQGWPECRSRSDGSVSLGTQGGVSSYSYFH
jgi:hypothetical protein